MSIKFTANLLIVACVGAFPYHNILSCEPCFRSWLHLTIMDPSQMLEDLAEAVYVLIRRCSKLSVENYQHGKLASSCHSLTTWLCLEGLGPVLSLTQAILTDGTLRTDFLGRPECRTFVLDTDNTGEEEDARGANLFGSANIESWLHLHLSNKVSIKKSDSMLCLNWVIFCT